VYENKIYIIVVICTVVQDILFLILLLLNANTDNVEKTYGKNIGTKKSPEMGILTPSPYTGMTFLCY